MTAYTAHAIRRGRPGPRTLLERGRSLVRFGLWRRDDDAIPTLAELEAYDLHLSQAGRSPGHRRNEATHVCAVLRWADGRPEFPHVRAVTNPAPPWAPTGDVEALSWAQMDAAIAHAGGYYETLFTLLRSTGLRPTQVMHLRWEHVDVRDATLTVPPNHPGSKSAHEKRGRIVPLPAWLAEEVAGWGRRDGWVIDKRDTVSPRGDRATSDARTWAHVTARRFFAEAKVPAKNPGKVFRTSHSTLLRLAGAGDALVDALHGRRPADLGLRHYTDWRRMLPRLREVVALVPPIAATGEVCSLAERRGTGGEDG